MRKICFISLLLLAHVFASRVWAMEWYVSPSGTAGGDGSIDDPWDLQTALDHPASVQPGDTIWLQEGTYTGKFVNSLQGASNDYITVRAVSGARATIDSYLDVRTGNGWVIFRDLEITSSDPNRTSSQSGSSPTDIDTDPGILVWTPNVKFINNIIHDVIGSGAQVFSSGPQEWYGNIIYNVGWDAPDRGHGHSLYSHNHSGGLREFHNNIFLRSMSGWNIHVFSASINRLRDYSFDKNISVGGISLIGGGGAASNLQIINNAFYGTRLETGYNLGTKDNEDAVIQGNYFAYTTASQLLWWQDLVVQDNTFIANTGANHVIRMDPDVHDTSAYSWNNNFYHDKSGSSTPFLLGNSSDGTFYSFGDWQTATGFDTSSSYTAGGPSGKQVFIFPNKYEAGRAHIAVYNWDKASIIPIDLSSLKLIQGSLYRLRNAYNYYDEYHEFTYVASNINVHMTGWTVATPTGGLNTIMSNTFPEFGVFVLELVEEITPPTPIPAPAPGPATPADTGSSSVTTLAFNPDGSVTTITDSSVSPVFPTVRLVQIPTGEAEISGDLQLKKKLQFAGQAPADGIVSIRLIDEAGRAVPGVAKVDDNGNWSWDPPLNLQPGEYTATFTVQDQQGNTGRTTLTFSIYEDGEPRVIESLQETDVSPGTEEVVSEPRSLWDDLIDFFRGLSQNFSSLVGMR